MSRFWSVRFWSVLTVAAIFAVLAIRAQEKPPAQTPQRKPDNYAGTVVEFTLEKVVVAKTKETRTFRITPDTKIEGKLKAKVRVTVRYTTDDGGYTATRIIVRTTTPKTK